METGSFLTDGPLFFIGGGGGGTFSEKNCWQAVVG